MAEQSAPRAGESAPRAEKSAFRSRFEELFAAREDLYAIRTSNGNYVPSVYEGDNAWTQGFVATTVAKVGSEKYGAEVIHAHMRGEVFAGVYPIHADSTVSWFALDFDGDSPEEAWAECVAQYRVLQEQGLQLYIERSRSGNGWHLWGFLSEPMNAGKVRHALKDHLLRSDSYDRMFPNQDGLSDAVPLGNLIALPLYGPNVAEGNSCFYEIGADGGPVQVENQQQFIFGVQRIAIDQIEILFQEAKQEYVGPTIPRVREGEAEGLRGAWKLVHPKFGCGWIRYCMETPEIDEPTWWALAHQLAQVEGGRKLFHEISAVDPTRYDPKDCDRKFDQAMRRNAPHRCSTIREQFMGGHLCDCDRRFPDLVHHPYDLCRVDTLILTDSVKEEQRIKTADTGFRMALNWAKFVQKHPEEGAGIRYGLQALDDHTRLRGSDLVIFAARPGIGKCLEENSLVFDPTTGKRHRIADLYRRQQATLATLREDGTLTTTRPSHFVDDGIRPTFRVRTKTGREIETTASHPFLTLSGWTKLMDLSVGARIGMPRALPYFGSEEIPEEEVKLLAYLIADGGLTTNQVRYTKNDPVLQREFAEVVASRFPGCESVLIPRQDRADTARVNGSHREMRPWLEAHGLGNKKASEKRVPEVIFTLSRAQIALFLNRLFSGDGSVEASGVVSYCSASKSLAEDVQHLLLRFGIVATLREKSVKYKEERRTAYEIGITSRQGVLTFLEEIGVYGAKGRAASRVRSAREAKPENPNLDTLPVEIWERIGGAKGDLSWAELARRAGIAPAEANRHAQGTNLHVGKRGLSRARLLRFADALQNESLRALASSDVYWDEIVEITPTGMKQVYDLTVPETHNFVANDLLVHNTAFALWSAYQMARRGVPIFFFSMEMSEEQLWRRMIAVAAQVDLGRMSTGKLTYAEWRRMHRVVAEVERNPLPVYVDDVTSHSGSIIDVAGDLSVKYGKGVVMVDYLQLAAKLPKESMFEKVTRLAGDFKGGAKLLHMPFLCLTQLNRTADDATAESQTYDSWLRGSGDIEQAADVIMFMLGEKGQGIKERTLVGHKERHREGGFRIPVEFNQAMMSFGAQGTWLNGTNPILTLQGDASGRSRVIPTFSDDEMRW